VSLGSVAGRRALLLQRWLAAFFVISTLVVPIAYGRPDDGILPFLMPVSALCILIFAAPVAFLGALVTSGVLHFTRWPPLSAWGSLMAIAAVGGMPGMVSVHRRLAEPAWYSYGDSMLPSLCLLAAIMTVTLVRSMLQPGRRAELLPQALIAASLVNFAFPWWPLD
jgi:hypothetical protein